MPCRAASWRFIDPTAADTTTMAFWPSNLWTMIEMKCFKGFSSLWLETLRQISMLGDELRSEGHRVDQMPSKSLLTARVLRDETLYGQYAQRPRIARPSP